MTQRVDWCFCLRAGEGLSGLSFCEFQGWAESGASPREWRAAILRQARRRAYLYQACREEATKGQTLVSSLEDQSLGTQSLSTSPALGIRNYSVPRDEGSSRTQESHGISPGPFLTQPG